MPTDDSLSEYLRDHLAGAVLAVDLLHSMAEEHAGQPIGRFAADIVREIEQDREVLAGLADRVSGPSKVKELGAWIGEKVARLKLTHRFSGKLGLFQGLEFLSLGILGKRALWHALAVAAPSDARLQGIDYQSLEARAQQQYDSMEAQRLEAARAALAAPVAAHRT